MKKIISIVLTFFLNACTSDPSSTNSGRYKSSLPIPNEVYKPMRVRNNRIYQEPPSRAERNQNEKVSKELCSGRK